MKKILISSVYLPSFVFLLVFYCSIVLTLMQQSVKGKLIQVKVTVFTIALRSGKNDSLSNEISDSSCSPCCLNASPGHVQSVLGKTAPPCGHYCIARMFF